jgi:GWxTD domain-containing protein
MRRFVAVVLCIGAASIPPRLARAQVAVASRPRPTMATRADSLTALHAMDEVLRTNHTDGAAWHERGVLAWRLSNAEKRTGYMKRAANDSLLELADSSLRLATKYNSASPEYLVDLGKFDLTSNSSSVRSRATTLFEKALDLARKANDSLGISRASDQLGMTWWRRYVDRANGHIYSVVLKNIKDRTALRDPRTIGYFINSQTIRTASQDWSGQVEYFKAWDAFSESLLTDPSNESALRHGYMALADRKRWVEMEHLARVRLNQDSTDAWAWLAYGLAAHRLDDDAVSSKAFRAGLGLLPDRERARYDRLSRIFTTKDSVETADLPPAEQVNLQRMYWLMADPLWAQADNAHRLEFLSRVVYAEFCFGVEEFDIHGADTDQGEVYVRYGPPPAVISIPADPFVTHTQDIRVLWWYAADEAFLFDQLPTYGVVTLEPDDKREVRHLRDTIPVVWRNAGDTHLVDSINVNAVRFRAPGDSGDVFVAAQVPVGRMLSGIDLVRGMLEVVFEGFTWRADSVFRRTDERVVSFGRADSNQVRTWSERVGPGTFLYRVEALQPDAMRGARGASRIELPNDHGFGLSDLLVAARVAPKAGVSPERWSDFDITPNFGHVERGHSFALLWETYGLTPANGSDDYKVSILVSRAKGTGFGAFVAKIVGGVASAVGLSRSGADSVALTFPRQIPAQPAAVDYVTLDMADAPPGSYHLDVTISDDHSGRRVSRRSTITVVE